MNPVQFALQDNAVHDILHHSAGSGVSIWGWIFIALLILALIFGFIKLFKSNRK